MAKRQHDEAREKAMLVINQHPDVLAEKQILNRARIKDFNYEETLKALDHEAVKRAAQVIESSMVMIEAAPPSGILTLTLTVHELRHYVHYMRALDDAYKTIFGDHSACEGKERGMKAEVERLRRDAREHLATIEVRDRQLKKALSDVEHLQQALNRAQG